MDVLSDVLRVVRMNGGGFLTAEFSAPWSIFSPPAVELARLMATRAESLALFHILVEGACWISLEKWPPIRLTAGNVIIFPHSPSHVMTSDPALVPEPIVPLLSFPEDRKMPQVRYGGDGETTRFVCGFLQCDQRFNPLIGALPSMLVVTQDTEDGQPAYALPADLPTVHMSAADDWLEKMLWHTVEEALHNRPGSAVMLARLTELFYVEVLRRYMQQLAAGDRGWLAAVADPIVGRALKLMHAEPARDWTVTSLGRAVGLSRSALAERFAELVGASPMQYLTTWRMQIAKDLLLRADLGTAQIAEKTGYGSEVSFTHAFKRHIGVPPIAWRVAFTSGPQPKAVG